MTAAAGDQQPAAYPTRRLLLVVLFQVVWLLLMVYLTEGPQPITGILHNTLEVATATILLGAIYVFASDIHQRNARNAETLVPDLILVTVFTFLGQAIYRARRQSDAG